MTRARNINYRPVTKKSVTAKNVPLDQFWLPKLVPLANFGPHENVILQSSKVAS